MDGRAVIKIVTWNMRDLFLKGARETRLEQFGGILKAIDPDIVCVQEIRGHDPGGSLARLGEAAGLDWRATPGWIDYDDGEMPTAAVGIADSDFHVGLLWRPGITLLPGTFRQIGRGDGGLWHAAASAAFDIGGPVPLTAIACHLDPFRPELRFSEAARIASLAIGKVAIVGGDFNCVSADRRPDGTFYDPDPIEQGGWHDAATFQVNWNDDPDAPTRVDRRAAERLRRAGLVDAAAAVNAPWQPSSGHWPDDPHGPRRVDRILVTVPVRPAVVSHQVINADCDRLQLAFDPGLLSDHLPVMIELDEMLLHSL
ncbi:endonuclease/exonuclease/phosphatase family metal-dependent hydrolase [Catenulispora sp. GAS73]|uniref:endonuclease/exonuclease/phosphatase family protein n=1 Tax=Catenulispora sp. GAS73 TaxID=3156269 RepID=UPI003519ABB7